MPPAKHFDDRSGKGLDPELSGEVLSQLFDVVGSLAQRWNAKSDYSQAKIQVLAEAAGEDIVPEIAMRRSDDAHTDGTLRAFPNANDRPVLHGAEQAWLHVRGEIGNLIEKHSSVPSGLEDADVSVHCTGERALAVAEELTAGQRSVQGSAVYRHERSARDSRSFVQRASHDFLAGT